MAQKPATNSTQTPVECTPPRSGSLEQNDAAELWAARFLISIVTGHNPLIMVVNYYLLCRILPSANTRLTMPNGMDELLRQIGNAGYVCRPADPKTLEQAASRGVPDALIDFYCICDGVFFGNGDDFLAPDGRAYRLHIPRLEELTTSQEYGYVFDDSTHYSRSANWWQIVDCGDANWLAFDSYDSAHQPIIEVFHESAGESEAQMIVASSFDALLQRFANGQSLYWFEDDFKPLGYI